MMMASVGFLDTRRRHAGTAQAHADPELPAWNDFPVRRPDNVDLGIGWYRLGVGRGRASEQRPDAASGTSRLRCLHPYPPPMPWTERVLFIIAALIGIARVVRARTMKDVIVFVNGEL